MLVHPFQGGQAVAQPGAEGLEPLRERLHMLLQARAEVLAVMMALLRALHGSLYFYFWLGVRVWRCGVEHHSQFTPPQVGIERPQGWPMVPR